MDVRFFLSANIFLSTLSCFIGLILFLIFKVPWYYYYTLALPCNFCKGCWAGNCDLLTVCQLHSDFRLHLLLCWPLNVFVSERLMRVSLKQQWHLKFSSFFSFEKNTHDCLFAKVCVFVWVMDPLNCHSFSTHTKAAIPSNLAFCSDHFLEDRSDIEFNRWLSIGL